MKFSRKNIENWRSWKMSFFWVGHFEFFFSKKKYFCCFIAMKISHKLCVRMDETQFLLLWWFTAKNERGNHKWAWVYIFKYVSKCFQNHFYLEEWLLKLKDFFCFDLMDFFCGLKCSEASGDWWYSLSLVLFLKVRSS